MEEGLGKIIEKSNYSSVEKGSDEEVIAVERKQEMVIRVQERAM